MDRVPARVKMIPPTATTVAGYPMLFPGTRPNSATVIALVNDRMAAAARTCSTTTGRSSGRLRPVTDMATNSSPIRAAAQPAIAGSSVS